MAKTKMVLQPIWPNPKDFPVGKLKALDRELTRVMRDKIGPLIKGDFEDTVQGWSSPPQFISKYSEPFGTQKQVEVYPAGRGTLQWSRVSEGTPAHIIAARRRPTLAYQKDFVPKTKPGGPYGGPGRKSGPWVTPKAVLHPGIEPRKFSVVIKNDREDEIYDMIYDTFEKFVGR